MLFWTNRKTSLTSYKAKGSWVQNKRGELGNRKWLFGPSMERKKC